MFRKIILLLFLFILTPPCFAVNEEDLNLEFFSRFNDPLFFGYINEAIQNNHSAKTAFYRVEQYRQEVKYQFGSELPSLSVSANYLGVKIPKLDNFELKENAFVLPFTASYEPDFLLKNRDKTRAVKKEYEAAIQDEKAVYISLLTDVSTVYTNILQYDKLIENQNRYLEADKKILEASKKKLQRGVIDVNEYNIALQNFETSNNDLADLIKKRDSLLFQFANLIGISPDNALEIKRGNFEDFKYQEDTPDLISSDVIFNRPDVKSAELKLEAARIDIRVARKEFLPSFNIVGLWTFNTLAPGTFFSWDSSLAAIFAGAAQDIFTGGKKVANLKMKKAKYEELFNNYKETDLNAVKEVNTALCYVKADDVIKAGADKKLKIEKEKYLNDKKKLERGIISNPEFLNSEKLVINRENEAINAETSRLISRFTLYKATGAAL